MPLTAPRQTDLPDPDDPLAGPEQPQLDGLIGYNIKRAYVVIQADFRAALGDGGLSPRVYSALSLVVQFPQITQSALARHLGIERSGLVAIVDDLEGRGYLARTTVPEDRRVQALVATEAGCAALDAATALVRAHEERLFGQFAPEERAVLLALLRRIRAVGEDDLSLET